MRHSLPNLALLAAFGASLLGSGGVSAAPLSPSFPGSEDSNVNPTLVESDPPQPQTHTKREEKEQFDWENWSSVGTSLPYNWTNSPWSANGVEQNRAKEDEIGQAQIQTAYKEIPQEKASGTPQILTASPLAVQATATPLSGLTSRDGKRKDGDGFGWSRRSSVGSPYNMTTSPRSQNGIQQHHNKTGQAIGQRIHGKRDGSEGSIVGKPGDDWTDSPRSQKGVGVVVQEGEEENDGPQLSERTHEQSARQELSARLQDKNPPKETLTRITMGVEIPDDMYLDIIATAVLARFTPEDKLAIRVQPEDKQLAKMSAMVERKLRRVVLGLYKTERSMVLKGARDKKEMRRLAKVFPELVRDQGFGGGEQECSPKKDIAPCVLAVWVLDVLGVPAQDVIKVRSHPKSTDPLARPIDIFKFMEQHDPENGFWKNWYDNEKKRMEGFPPHEAKVSEKLMVVIKDAMVRGKANGKDIETDLQWRLNDLPEERDKLTRFFSLLYHRGEHLKTNRPQKIMEESIVF